MDNRKVNIEYSHIGTGLIQDTSYFTHIRESKARIVYLESEQAKKHKGKKILGQCEKVADKYKWGIPCDFTITLFTPNIKGLSDEAIKRIIMHELLHVGIKQNDDGSEHYYVVPHDTEDFKFMLDNFGTEWWLA